MIKVGVTGGMGSGKSLVCSIFSAMGYPVFNADYEARLVVENDTITINKIKALFGESIYTEGRLNRAKVGEMVFSNPSLLEKLNGIVHPPVIERFFCWTEENKQHALVVMEAAILFESGTDKGVDKVISVIAPTEIRVERIKARDGLSQELISDRMNRQLPQDELIKRSDFIIDNDGVKLIVPQVIKIVNDLVKV
jgi:dephospho-CoA kinase